MDQKTWLWRKKPSEKTIVISEEEVESLPTEKELELESSLHIVNEKLASVIDECSAKEEVLKNYEKMAEDSMTDKEKADEEIRRLKEALDETLQQKTTANERLSHLNSALKGNMQQLTLMRQEREQYEKDAVEKAHKKLEEKLANVTVENTYLSKAILVKDKLIEDLNTHKSQSDSEFEILMSRLNSVEKENTFLKYEFKSLEKELDLRNDELELNRRSADISSKKIKKLEADCQKIKKLEADCQRLRSLTRIKYLPTPSTNFEVQGRNQINTRRNVNSVSRESIESKKLSLLMGHLKDLEKENENLKECLAKKEEEITSKYSAHDELCSNEITCSRSWASDMSLMDDFVEMEKLAIVAVDPPPGGSSLSDSSKMLCITWKSPTSSPRSISSLHHSTVRDEFRKYLGGGGPGTAFQLECVQNLMTEMEKMYEGLKNESNVIKSFDLARQENDVLKTKLQEAQESIAKLQNELEIMKESKRITEDQVEKHKLLNEELDIQLSITRVELNEAVQKLSSAEVELDGKSHCCEELEGSCINLQLQLQSITSKQHTEKNKNQEDQLQTGLEITKASACLAECEETIMKLGNHIKAIGSGKELAIVEKAPSVRRTNSNQFKSRSSLRDQLLSEDSAVSELLSIFEANTSTSKSTKAGALIIVPSKRRGGRMGFLKKLLLSKKKASGKTTTTLW